MNDVFHYSRTHYGDFHLLCYDDGSWGLKAYDEKGIFFKGGGFSCISEAKAKAESILRQMWRV